MAEYVYGTSGNTATFGSRDTLPPGNAQKVVSGSQFDTEFVAVQNGKLDKEGNDFTGTIDGGTY